jgi:hypothetical protein
MNLQFKWLETQKWTLEAHFYPFTHHFLFYIFLFKGKPLLIIFEYLETWLMLVQVEHVQACFACSRTVFFC